MTTLSTLRAEQHAVKFVQYAPSLEECPRYEKSFHNWSGPKPLVIRTSVALHEFSVNAPEFEPGWHLYVWYSEPPSLSSLHIATGGSRFGALSGQHTGTPMQITQHLVIHTR
jgi:hypothetical protein